MLNILQSRSQKEALYNVIVMLIYIIILTILLRFLWNQSLVKHVSILKPVDSLWHTFLLAVAVAAFKC
jgi:amino acid permease